MKKYLLAAIILIAMMVPSHAAWTANGTGRWIDCTLGSSSSCVEMFNGTGAYTWTAPATLRGNSVWYLVVAAGGAGGNLTKGGGGGAGGVLNGTTTVTPGNSYNVTVGRGGINYLPPIRTYGGNSTFANTTLVNGFQAMGGGIGVGAAETAGNGGSGGGSYTGTIGTGVSGQGHNGSIGINGGTYFASGAGGGAGSQPLDATTGTAPAGGSGLPFSINGTTIWYCGGGGGSGSVGQGAGGIGGGGAGATGTATMGTDGLGGGGGGSYNGAGGNGGNGSVLLRYRTIELPVANFIATPTVGTAALLVQFTDLSTNETPITSWNWSFGDYSYSDDQNPQHVYATYGVYNINLTITTAEDTVWHEEVDYVITRTDQNPPSVTSFPKYVTINVQDAWGNALEDANVTMTPLSTSTTSWDWLMSVIGLSDDVFDTNSTVMMQNTSIHGSAEFYVIPTTKYHIDITKAGYTFSDGNFVPTDSEYTFRAGFLGTDLFDSGYDVSKDIQFFTNASELNTTHGNVHVQYIDLLGQSTNVNVSIYQTVVNGNSTTRSLVTSYTSVASGNFTHDFVLTGCRGKSYIVGCNSTGTIFSGEKREYGVTFKPGPISLGIPEDLLLYIGMFGLVFISLLFVRTLPGPATVITMFFAWIFYLMGWWRELASEPIVVAALIFWSGVAIIFNVMIRSKKTYMN